MRYAPDLKNERGIALALAVFALVVIGALVAGTVFAGRLEQRGGQNTIYAGQAFEAADAGLSNTMANWGASYNKLAVGDSLSLATTELGSGSHVWVGGTIVRVNDMTFLVRSAGEARDGNGNILAQRSLAMLAKLYTTSVPIRAALAARGDLIVKGTADLYGINGDPPGWQSSPTVRDACPVDGTSVPSAEVTGIIDSTHGNPTMNPPPVDSSTALQDTSTFTNPYNELAQNANITLPGGATPNPAPSASGTPLRCNTAFSSNWGEPGTAVPACADYFPIIHVLGNMKITSSGRGQGILLVDGDLELAGGFTFAGIIITKGNFSSSNGTNQVYGTVLANNATLQDIGIAGTPQVQFSTCAVSRALTASAKAKPFTSRAWAQIY